MPDRQKLIGQINQVLALNGDLMTLEDLIDLARERRVQVFGGDDAVVASEILTYPRKNICNAFLAAGSLRGILRLESEVEAYARAHDAAAIVTHGRQGWGRVGQKTGWMLHSLCYVKPLHRKSNGGSP